MSEAWTLQPLSPESWRILASALGWGEALAAVPAATEEQIISHLFIYLIHVIHCPQPGALVRCKENRMFIIISLTEQEFHASFLSWVKDCTQSPGKQGMCPLTDEFEWRKRRDVSSARWVWVALGWPLGTEQWQGPGVNSWTQSCERDQKFWSRSSRKRWEKGKAWSYCWKIVV